MLWPDGTGTELYWTVDPELVEQCRTKNRLCSQRVYKPNYGRSKPDGPGIWIKYSTYAGTFQIAAGSPAPSCTG
jgi:hypothetical protein